MDFEIYTDESGLEVLADASNHKFMCIGGVWIPARHREDFKRELNAIKKKHRINGEMKWQKVSPAYLPFYEDVLRYYFANSCIRARVVVIESSQIDNIKFNGSDNELGFYKFYYQLIHHWIYDFNQYDVFIDHKINRSKGRIKDLKKVLQNANLTSGINNVQALPSEQSLGIQLADFITGIVASKFNGQTTSAAKKSLIELLESKECLAKPIAATPKWEEKLNVFRINLTGGW